MSISIFAEDDRKPEQPHVDRVRPAETGRTAASGRRIYLMFAQLLKREREFAIRAALGATKARLARQLLSEAHLPCCASSNRMRH